MGPPKFTSPSGLLMATASVGLCLWLLSNTTKLEAMTAAIAGDFGLLLYSLCKTKRSVKQSDEVVLPNDAV